MGLGTAHRPDVSQRVQTSKAESPNSVGLPQEQADGEALTAPSTESATKCSSNHTSGPPSATHAFTRSTCDVDYNNASLPAASLVAISPTPLQGVKQVEDLTHQIRTLELALEQHLGALLRQIVSIEHQVGYLASQINIPYPGNRANGVEQQMGHLAAINVPHPSNLGAGPWPLPAVYTQPAYGIPQTAMYTLAVSFYFLFSLAASLYFWNFMHNGPTDRQGVQTPARDQFPSLLD